MATSWIGHITVQCLVHCTVIALKMSVIEGLILGVMSTCIALCLVGLAGDLGWKMSVTTVILIVGHATVYCTVIAPSFGVFACNMIQYTFGAQMCSN